MAPLRFGDPLVYGASTSKSIWTPTVAMVVLVICLALTTPIAVQLCACLRKGKKEEAKEEAVPAPTEGEEGEEGEEETATTDGTTKKSGQVKKKGKKGGKAKKKAAIVEASKKEGGEEDEEEGEPLILNSATAGPSGIVAKSAVDKTAIQSAKSGKESAKESGKASPKAKKKLGKVAKTEYKTLAEADSQVFDEKGTTKEGQEGAYRSITSDKKGKGKKAQAAGDAPAATLAAADSNVFDEEKEPSAKPAPKKKGKGKKAPAISVAPLATLAGADSNVFDAPKPKKGKKGR